MAARLIVAILALPTLLAENCEYRTEVYRRLGPTNADYRYYDPRSYGRLVAGNVPASLPLAKAEYDALAQAIKCVGKWCQGETWGCPGSNKACYNTHRLISPRSDIPALRDCSPADFDVAGNYIKAYGLWAQSLSAGAYAERREIYGDLLEEAFRAVCESCGADCDAPSAGLIPIPDCGEGNAGGDVALAVVAGELAVIVGALLGAMVLIAATVCRRRAAPEFVGAEDPT